MSVMPEFLCPLESCKVKEAEERLESELVELESMCMVGIVIEPESLSLVWIRELVNSPALSIEVAW